MHSSDIRMFSSDIRQHTNADGMDIPLNLRNLYIDVSQMMKRLD